jgi:addiction module RelE/StbE family toxin
MKIIWTKEALEKLTEIEDYISKDSPVRAARFVDQLVEHPELLSNNPRLGRMVPEIANPVIRELIFKKYRIVYRLNEESVEILTVFEGHMLLRIDESYL